jgi:hypothetical protein
LHDFASVLTTRREAKESAGNKTQDNACGARRLSVNGPLWRIISAAGAFLPAFTYGSFFQKHGASVFRRLSRKPQLQSAERRFCKNSLRGLRLSRKAGRNLISPTAFVGSRRAVLRLSRVLTAKGDAK